MRAHRPMHQRHWQQSQGLRGAGIENNVSRRDGRSAQARSISCARHRLCSVWYRLDDAGGDEPGDPASVHALDRLATAVYRRKRACGMTTANPRPAVKPRDAKQKALDALLVGKVIAYSESYPVDWDDHTNEYVMGTVRTTETVVRATRHCLTVEYDNRWEIGRASCRERV